MFVFSTVISFPYLIALIEGRIPGTGLVFSGALFALPHLCYLLTAMAVHRLVRHRARLALTVGFGCIALGLAGHWPAHPLAAVLATALPRQLALPGLPGLTTRRSS